MADKNPIELELEKMDEQWDEFIDSDAPIFRWSLPHNALQLANTFVQVRETMPDDSRDLFIPLRRPFQSAERFGFDLTEEMNTQLDEGFKSAIAAEQEEGDTKDKNEFNWQKDSIANYDNGFKALLTSSQKIIDAFDDYIDLLVLIVMPPEASSVKEYQAWWASCALVHEKYSLWPPRLKLLVFENASAPMLTELAETKSEQIFSLCAPLDLQAATAKVLEDADNGSPGAKIRKELTALNFALSEQNKEEIEKRAAAALKIADYYNMLDMLATVHMMRGAAYLNLGEYKQSVADYRAAQNFAVEGQDKKVAACDKLLLQAAICEGSAFFSAKDYRRAAVTFERAAGVGEAQEDLLMTMEAWRMASFSREQNKEKEAAWEHAMKALEVGKTMEDEARTNSTLAYVGDALLRLAPTAQDKQSAQHQMNTLLGDDWLEQMHKVSA